MRHIGIALLLCISIFQKGHTQKEYEIGGMLGGATYFGEVNTTNLIHQVRPGAFLFGRYNIHKQLALRANLGFAMLGGNDQYSGFEYQNQREIAFSSSLISLSSNVEFNFLPFKADRAKSVFSPYLTVGLETTLVNFSFDAKVLNNISLPFGVGFKLNLPKRWNAGIEYIIHKTFRDDLDRLDNPLFSEQDVFQYKQRANSRNKDWYTFFGIYIAYKLKSSVTCRAYS
ncbi:MAG: DUF6089 family protein [Salinivirgaceae bacterium]|nr:DUF6089 family protein [Salinivirgaceae bacterium]MDY0279591.1 DUF6089 family protein [Salinivirgaceae bacterium]